MITRQIAWTSSKTTFGAGLNLVNLLRREMLSIYKMMCSAGILPQKTFGLFTVIFWGIKKCVSFDRHSSWQMINYVYYLLPINWIIPLTLWNDTCMTHSFNLPLRDRLLESVRHVILLEYHETIVIYHIEESAIRFHDTMVGLTHDIKYSFQKESTSCRVWI